MHACACVCAVYDTVKRSDTVGRDSITVSAHVYACVHVYVLCMTLSSVLIQLVRTALLIVCV